MLCSGRRILNFHGSPDLFSFISYLKLSQEKKKKTSSQLLQTHPDTLPLSSGLLLIELRRFPGGKAISSSAGL